MSTSKKLTVITINSTAYFMLAYISFIVLINLISIIMANIVYDTSGTLYHYGFELVDKNFSWSLDSVILIFFIGVFVALLFAIYFQFLYKSIRKVTSGWKLFLLWFYLIAYTVFFGDILFGTFLNYMPGAFFNFMFLSMPARIIIGIIGVVALFVVGVASAKNILISLNIYLKKVNATASNLLIMSQILFPFIIGNVIIFLLKIPNHSKFGYIDTFVLLSMLIIIIAAFGKIHQMDSVIFKRHFDKFQLKPKPIIAAVIAILIFRLGLGAGITL